jgi:hypothetical protein
MSDPVTGHCLCGAVRFEITGPLRSARYCHCTRCQRRTGTASSIQARFDGGDLRYLAGEEVVRGWQPPEGFAKLFCSQCGSSMFSRDPEDPSVMSVRLGVLDGDPGIRPEFRQHVASAAAWEPIPDDGLPRYPGHPPA